MIEIDWAKDYKREFVCPHCSAKDMRLRGQRNNKKLFRCHRCKKNIASSADITSKKQKTQKNTIKIDWKQDYKKDFNCPNCGTKEMSLSGTSKEKRRFRCNKCKTYSLNSCYINYRSRYIEPIWDLFKHEPIF